MAEPSLLPANATPFEGAQSLADAARWPLPTHLIKDVWNPATCPADLLPYLAAGLGLEIWHDDWTEAFKRSTIANIWALKRNKTKLKGISAYLALESAELVAARRPRDKFWWSGGQTDAQRLTLMASMPQIHIATAPSIQTASIARTFWSGRFLRQAWRSKRFWTVSDAATLYEHRATYVDQGISRVVTVRGIDDPLGAAVKVEIVAAASSAKMFWGARRSWGAAVYQESDAEQHVIALTPDQGAPMFAIPSGLVPVNVRPLRERDTVAAKAGQRFWGTANKAGLSWGGGDGVYRASDALAHVYDQITLFDPARMGPTLQPYSFWGSSRWGRPAYTAQLRVQVTLQRPPMQQGWGRPWGRNYWRTSDMSPLWRALAAVRTSQAYRDTISIDTQLYQAIRFSAGLRFGDAAFKQFGDMKRLQ